MITPRVLCERPRLHLLLVQLASGQRAYGWSQPGPVIGSPACQLEWRGWIWQRSFYRQNEATIFGLWQSMWQEPLNFLSAWAWDAVNTSLNSTTFSAWRQHAFSFKSFLCIREAKTRGPHHQDHHRFAAAALGRQHLRRPRIMQLASLAGSFLYDLYMAIWPIVSQMCRFPGHIRCKYEEEVKALISKIPRSRLHFGEGFKWFFTTSQLSLLRQARKRACTRTLVLPLPDRPSKNTTSTAKCV